MEPRHSRVGFPPRGTMAFLRGFSHWIQDFAGRPILAVFATVEIFGATISKAFPVVVESKLPPFAMHKG
jgi:hypothetical protein